MLIYSLVGAVLLISSFVMFISAIKVTDLTGFTVIKRAFAAVCQFDNLQIAKSLKRLLHKMLCVYISL